MNMYSHSIVTSYKYITHIKLTYKKRVFKKYLPLYNIHGGTDFCGEKYPLHF